MVQSSRSRQRTVLGTLVVATTLAVICGCAPKQDAPPSAQAGPNPVNVTAGDYAFKAPDSVPAGLAMVRLVNTGPSIHHIQLVQLLEGKTVPDLMKAMGTAGPPPTWIKWIGGPNAVVPGGPDTSVAYMTLPAGNYALICVIPDSAGKPHVLSGMAKALTVTASSATPAAAPQADIEIHLKDYDFTVTGTLSAGQHNIRIVNDGPQTHEVLLAALAPGKTPKNLLDWVDGGMKGMPPAKPMGGATGLAPGAEQVMSVRLAAGKYGLFCFLPDAKDGKEHAMHGMMKQITVN